MVLCSQFPEGGAAGRAGTGEVAGTEVLSPKGRGGGSTFRENEKEGTALQSLTSLGFEQLKSSLGWVAAALVPGPEPGAARGQLA